MLRIITKWSLALAFICLMPVALSAKQDRDHGCDHNSRGRKCQLPEGGSTAIYVLGAGVTCLGAMVIRSRGSKSRLL